ncbi:hypothetical protein [Paenibacillus tundrae]
MWTLKKDPFYDDGSPIIPVTEWPFGEEIDHVTGTQEEAHTRMAREDTCPPQPETGR